MNRSDIMFNTIIEEICKELNIKYTYLSNKWIIKLDKLNKTKYIIGEKFDLNKYISAISIDDKNALYEILNNISIPSCIHNIIFNNISKKELTNIFIKYNNDVVIKPNIGCSGIDVYRIKDKEELIKKTNQLLKKYTSISICPYYNIKYEYRVIVLDNEVKLVFRKENAKIVGDGKSSIKELLIKFNKYYFENKDLPETILKKDEKYTYDWRFNLSKGSIASISIDDKLKDKLSKIAVDVTNELNIRFASVDIIELNNNELLILEANNCVTLNKCINFIPNGYNIAKDIYKEAMIKMFED